MDKKKYTILYENYDDILEYIKDINHKNLPNIKQIIIELSLEEYNNLVNKGFYIDESKPLEYGLLGNPTTAEYGIPPPIFSYFKIDQAHAAGFNGRGVKVALLGTGCNYTYGNCVTNLVRATFVATAADIDTENHESKGCLFVGQTRNINDSSSIANYGIAYNATIYSLKVLDGTSTNTDIVEAIEYCVSNSIDIINCSFFTTDNSAALTAAFNSALSLGKIVVCAVGNNPSASMVYPANIPGVIAVNNVQNYAPDIPIGSYINTTNNVTVTTYSTGHAQVSLFGTSQAAHQLSGVLAIYKQKYPSLTTEKAIRLLQRRAVRFDGFTYNLSSNTRGILLNNETGAGFVAPLN